MPRPPVAAPHVTSPSRVPAGRGTRGPLAFLLLAVLAILTAPVASAHGPGSNTIVKSGSFSLTPLGTNTTTSTFHAYIASIGLPIGPGDTLRFSWEVGVGNPPVHFQIHAHPSTGGFPVYYNTTAVAVNDAWVVPNYDPSVIPNFMVYWENLNTVNVTVAYQFQLVPPAQDPILYLLVVFAVAVGVVVVLRVRRWRSTKAEKKPIAGTAEPPTSPPKAP